MFRLLLVRHGETVWNKETRLQGGGSDIELNDMGKKQAELVALALKRERLDAIASSTLKRALYTAQAIARYHNLEVETYTKLKEIDAGTIDGLLGQEISKIHPDFYRQWASGQVERIPGGESLKEVQDRVWSVVEGLKERYPGGKVVVISHTFVTSSIICRALGVDLRLTRRISSSNAGITLLEFNSAYATLVYFNNTGHLRN